MAYFAPPPQYSKGSHPWPSKLLLFGIYDVLIFIKVLRIRFQANCIRLTNKKNNAFFGQYCVCKNKVDPDPFCCMVFSISHLNPSPVQFSSFDFSLIQHIYRFNKKFIELAFVVSFHLFKKAILQ